MSGASPRRRGRWLAVLVGYYGLYQFGHATLNTTYLLHPGTPPFPPPPQGWQPQAVALLTGMAALDLLNALLSLVFVAGWFRRARWNPALGLATLTVSVYAAAVFTWGTIDAGAWSGHLDAYLLIYLPFLPVLVLATTAAAAAAGFPDPLDPQGARPTYRGPPPD